jgi:hypothetical protein
MHLRSDFADALAAPRSLMHLRSNFADALALRGR